MERVPTGFSELDALLDDGFVSPSCVCVGGQLDIISQRSFILQMINASCKRFEGNLGLLRLPRRSPHSWRHAPADARKPPSSTNSDVNTVFSDGALHSPILNATRGTHKYPPQRRQAPSNHPS
jgi:hypothetical protein